MRTGNEVLKGWQFATDVMGADVVSRAGDGYVKKVEEAILELETSINNHTHQNLGIAQLQGYMQEEWAAGTFNIDAVAAGSSDHATVLHSNAKDSVDILLKSGVEYGAKSYKNGAESAKQQARLNPETRQASYHGQMRLVPADQLSDAKEKAHHEMLRNRDTRPDVSAAYAETEENLTSTIQNDKGISSRAADRKDYDKMAQESKDQNFRAENHDVTTQSAIKSEYLVKQALKAGYTAAAVTVAFQLAPEIYKAIDYLIKNGQLDVQQIKRMGVKGISAGAEGFLRGTISSSLMIMCETGALGQAFQGIAPTVLGTTVALVMQTVKNSILVASGRMSAQQMGAAFTDTVIISGGYFLGSHIGGIIGQSLGFGLPVVGYLLGSLIGTSFCVIYNIGKNKLISFCVDTGFTCFGLVEQNYQLPDSVLNELGIKTIQIPQTQIARADISRTPVLTTHINMAEHETIHLSVLRRGIIGVNKIGYVLP